MERHQQRVVGQDSPRQTHAHASIKCFLNDRLSLTNAIFLLASHALHTTNMQSIQQTCKELLKAATPVLIFCRSDTALFQPEMKLEKERA